jgi:hypothetical protein
MAIEIGRRVWLGTVRSQPVSDISGIGGYAEALIMRPASLTSPMQVVASFS